MIYSSTLVTYSLMISTLFEKASMASNIGWLLFLFNIIIYNIFDENFFKFPYIVRILMCLLINFNLGLGIDLILYFEKYEEGIQFENLFEREVVMDFTFGGLLLSMLLLSLLQILFYFTITKFFHNNDQSPELPLQVLLKGFKKSKSKKLNFDDCLFETDDEKQTAIKFVKLNKKLGKKYVLKNFSLDVQKNQITVLFGELRKF